MGDLSTSQDQVELFGEKNMHIASIVHNTRSGKFASGKAGRYIYIERERETISHSLKTKSPRYVRSAISQVQDIYVWVDFMGSFEC